MRRFLTTRALPIIFRPFSQLRRAAIIRGKLKYITYVVTLPSHVLERVQFSIGTSWLQEHLPCCLPGQICSPHSRWLPQKPAGGFFPDSDHTGAKLGNNSQQFTPVASQPVWLRLAAVLIIRGLVNHNLAALHIY